MLSVEPDSDTIDALSSLAGLEAVNGNLAEGERLASEGLGLAQALDAGPVLSAYLFLAKGLSAAHDDRLTEAAAYYEAAGRLAEAGGDLGALGTSQLNLADVLLRSKPRDALGPARSAAGHARRTGRQRHLATAIANLALAEIELGDWDGAWAGLSEAIEVEHLESTVLHALRGCLAGRRGDKEATAASSSALERYRKTEDPQDKSIIGLVDALTSLLSGNQKDALAHGLSVLELGVVLGISADAMRFSWPLSARAARSLGDAEALEGLLRMLDAHPVGHLPPVLRAGRKLVRALVDADAALAASPPMAGPSSEVDASAGPAALEPSLACVADAISAFREVGNPYELAHGLIDQAQVLARAGGVDEEHRTSVEANLAEARDIAERLRCPPLADRADEAAAAHRSSPQAAPA